VAPGGDSGDRGGGQWGQGDSTWGTSGMRLWKLGRWQGQGGGTGVDSSDRVVTPWKG